LDEEGLLARVVVDPKVMVGKPVIKGTRIPVELILRLLAQGLSADEILGDYPQLAQDDIKAALLYAARITEREEVYPAAPG